MAEDDIYGSRGKYLRFLKYYKTALLATKVTLVRGERHYFCRNPKNVRHFTAIIAKFDARDLSYVRRLRLLNTMKLVCYATEKDLRSCGREDIDDIMAFMHTRLVSPKSKGDFIKDVRHIWRQLFPEKDVKGRIDETLVPYPVRHLIAKQDKSREKARPDRQDYLQFLRVMNYFSNDARILSYLAHAFESLARPQGLLYTRIKDYLFLDTHARVTMSEHGKEGIGLLQCIDSYPYVLRWYQQHPQKDDPNAFFYINLEGKNKYKQLQPNNINKMLAKACAELKVPKITCYSIKRNGVSFRRLRGESDMEIQHAAGWTSDRQLKTYDMTRQEDAMNIQLAKRGIAVAEKYKAMLPKSRACPYCGKVLGFSEKICPSCMHVLDTEQIKKIEKEKEGQEKRIQELQKDMAEMKKYLRKKGFTGHPGVEYKKP